MRNSKIHQTGMAVVLLVTSPAFAHHSFAMFDNEKTVTLEGTVKEFQWTNPHSWVQLMVTDPATGKAVEWSIEAGSPNGLERQGWTRHAAKEGGSLISMSVNGQKIGR
jgi:hypothetical protein